MSTSVRQKTVLVTGAGSGIGAAIVSFLVEKNWTVFAGVRKEQDAERLRSEHTNIKPVILDITDQAQVNRAIEEVRAAVGEDGLDCLINNAGMAIIGPFEYTPLPDIIRQFEVNLFGVVRLIQAAMPLIRMGKPGRVINIGSIGSEFNLPYLGIYQSTKSALLTISESFRREVARWGIKVVLIQPGGVKTNFESAATQQYIDLKAKFPPGSECHDRYGKDLDHIPEAAKQFTENAVAPRVVAQRVYAAMTVKNPKNIYHDTWISYFTVQMIHWMPYWFMDRQFAKFMHAKD